MTLASAPQRSSDAQSADSPKNSALANRFSATQLRQAFIGSLRKLGPRTQARNPVMFVVWVGSILTTLYAIAQPSVFSWATAIWLWATVIFAGFAESMAEGRGKAQAESLRKVTTETMAHRRVGGPDSTQFEDVPSTSLRIDDIVQVSAGEVIPGDGDVVEGIASVDESAITGESAPVVRESGGDRCAVTGGTVVLSDQITVRITTAPGESFVERMIGLVEGAERRKTPNEIALNILLAMLTIVFLIAVVALAPMARYSGAEIEPIRLIALLVCLIPTTIGALLSAIGIAGMDRLVQHNVLAMSGRAVEAAGDVDTLLLDKTGTITYGARQATAFHPATGVDMQTVADAALHSSIADDTPEGRSIIDLCEKEFGLQSATYTGSTYEVVPFTAQTRMSGIDFPSENNADEVRCIRKGASDSVIRWVTDNGGSVPDGLPDAVRNVAARGATPLVVAELTAELRGTDIVRVVESPRILGVIELSDIVKPGMRQKFDELRAMGIRTVMVTGDNPVTAAAIAEEAGVDEYISEATPEDKLAKIQTEQAGGRMVAMTGDGTNDAPALAQADVGVAMNTGTSAAKEAANMVDLDSDPTKLIQVVATGKQLLITRGALTTFSLANDLAKYFAILPALFVTMYPQLDKLNIMGLASPESAILSAVIFNALIIVALVPLALKGVRYRSASGASLLRRNLAIYGLGGIIAPFIGIWLIDLIVRLIPGIA